MATIRNYDPRNHILVWKGIQFVAFAKDTFIEAERAEDTFKMDTGGMGDVTRVRSRNRTGSITVRLQGASPTNDLLTALMVEDELFGTGAGPISLVDKNSATVISASSAWIRKAPSVEVGTDAPDREWVFDCADLSVALGGAIL